jgi:hypothetical protein
MTLSKVHNSSVTESKDTGGNAKEFRSLILKLINDIK